ncbi:hypothetical protein DXV75_13415 [Alteromonas aestuariivivens]|uniref:Uncharacterized protein n=1 Tax=Alteromonas aestuariivivens TaxID=1938339 RepID=A0A3D8M4R4_9ALTE|nr:hypothetical protein DXV75_13415 [Alteromonas aestuariivivens]
MIFAVRNLFTQSEPEGQHLSCFSAALAAVHVGDCTSQPLPCINARQFAEKLNSKDQQALGVVRFEGTPIFAKSRSKRLFLCQ